IPRLFPSTPTSSADVSPLPYTTLFRSPRTETRALAQSQCTPPGQHQSPDLPTLEALVGWFPYFPQHNGARRTTAEGDVQPTIRRCAAKGRLPQGRCDFRAFRISDG